MTSLLEPLYRPAMAKALRPPPQLLVSEWADKHRYLSPASSAEPGRWRTDRTPYLRELMDVLSAYNRTQKVAFMKGAQVGGTEAGNNWIGYIISHVPGPMLVVLPTVEMGKRWSKGRFALQIEASPVLREKIKSPRSRDSGNTVQSKEFPGGIIVITGANSAVGLRSIPVRYLFLDEVDAYPGDADGEGDPVQLAVQRTNTFARKKILMVSTPTIQGLSRIEKEFLASDQRYFYVPCPHCEKEQRLLWPQMKWKEDDPTTVYMECAHCGEAIYNRHKAWMLPRGRWIKHNPEAGFAGFHLSSLYSPVGWYGWDDAVRDFLSAKKDPELLKVWVNTVLGETWVDQGEAPDWERLFERAEDYTIGKVPEGGLFLTAGADVQKDRIEVEIVAWGESKESWSVDYRVLYGDPAGQAVWQTLSNMLEEQFPHASGIHLPISMLAVDSGYATQEVYAWCRKHPSNRVMAIKGSEKAILPLGTPSKVDVTIGGRRLKRGARVWPIGVSVLKSELYAWLRLMVDENGNPPPGYCHFPKYDAEFFKQLTAEQLVTKQIKGYPKREWQKLRDRNEALDCRVYARAAAIAMGMDRWTVRKWNTLGAKFQEKPKDTLPETAETKPARNKGPCPRVIKSQWMS